MTPEQWQKAKELLVLASSLPLSKQQEAVLAAFPDDAILQQDVFQLLQASSSTGLTTESPAAERDTEARPPLLASGEMCGPFKVISKIGVGGMGEVFLAEDLRVKMPGLRARRVALKCPTGRWVEAPDARYRLLLEFATAATLGPHPHIATAFDALDVRDGQLVLVMEFIDGTPLNRLIAKGRLPWRFALTIATQVAEALGHAHDSNVLHCDIKSGNVIVTAQNQAKMLDFGLSRARQLPGDDSGRRVGTLPYMPPERIIDGTLDASGDLYALGVTLFEMLTGRRPFTAPNELELIAEILDATPPRVSTLVSGLPSAVDQIVARALARDPRQRFQSAREFIAALRQVLHKREPTWVERVVQGAWLAVALFAITLVSGFLGSTAINVGLGRTGGFESDLQRSTLVWGAMSMTAPLLFVMALLLSAGVLGVVIRLLSRIPAIRVRVDPLNARLAAAWKNAVTSPTDMVSQIVFLAQIAGLGTFIWHFFAVIAGIAHFMVDTAPGSVLELRPSNQPMHEVYRSAVSLLLFLVAASSAWLIRLRRANGERTAVVALAGVMTFAIGLFLFAVPFQVLFHNKAERVVYATNVCYQVARNTTEGLARLYCPAATGAERIQTVRVNDPRVVHAGPVESVFTELDRQPAP
jgi:hypothetical protein